MGGPMLRVGGSQGFLPPVLTLLEYPSGGACVCGQPVEVFFGEGFGRCSGCVDDAQGVIVVDDRDCQGVSPAGVRTGRRQASGAGTGQGGGGGLDDQVYHAPVRSREIPGRMFSERREIRDPDQGNPVGFELAPQYLGDLLGWSLGVEVFWRRGTKHELRGEDEVNARPCHYAEQIEKSVVRKVV